MYVMCTHTVEIYLLRQKLCYNEAKCYSRHSFITTHSHLYLIPTIYTSVKLKICAARRTYKRQPFISKKKKNVLQAKRKCGMFWNIPYIQSAPHTKADEELVADAVYEELAVWNMRPAYALTII